MALLGRFAAVVGFTVLGAGLACCSLLQSDAPPDQTNVSEAGASEAGEGGGSSGGGDGSAQDGAASTTAQIRLAYIATSASQPAIDFCLAPAVGGYGPPILYTQFGASARLAPYEVSQYASVPLGDWVMSIAPSAGGGDVSCGSAGAVQLPHLPTLTAGLSLTIVVPDMAGGTTSPVVLTDEGANAAGGKIRFFNAAPGTAYYGLGGGIAFTPLTPSGVSQGSVDITSCGPHGYCPVSSASGLQTDSSVQIGGVEVASTANLALSSGSLITTFAFQGTGPGVDDAGAADGGSASGYGVVWCDDLSGGTDASLGACNVTTGASTSQVRFAGFELGESDGGTDLCLRYQGFPSFLGPVFGGGGLAPLAVSPYEALHGGFTYDVELVPTGSTGCLSPIDGTLGSITIASANAEGSTVGVMGLMAALVDAGVDAGDAGDEDAGDAGDAGADASADDAGEAGVDASSPIATAGSIAYYVFPDYASDAVLPVVRVINAASGAQEALTVTSSDFAFLGVPYGQAGTNAGAGSGDGGAIDSHGFLPVQAGSGTLNVAGETFAWTVGPTDFDTFYLYGGGTESIGVLDCVQTPATPASCQALAP